MTLPFSLSKTKILETNDVQSEDVRIHDAVLLRDVIAEHIANL